MRHVLLSNLLNADQQAYIENNPASSDLTTRIWKVSFFYMRVQEHNVSYKVRLAIWNFHIYKIDNTNCPKSSKMICRVNNWGRFTYMHQKLLMHQTLNLKTISWGNSDGIHLNIYSPTHTHRPVDLSLTLSCEHFVSCISGRYLLIICSIISILSIWPYVFTYIKKFSVTHGYNLTSDLTTQPECYSCIVITLFIRGNLL